MIYETAGRIGRRPKEGSNVTSTDRRGAGRERTGRSARRVVTSVITAAIVTVVISRPAIPIAIISVASVVVATVTISIVAIASIAIGGSKRTGDQRKRVQAAFHGCGNRRRSRIRHRRCGKNNKQHDKDACYRKRLVRLQGLQNALHKIRYPWNVEIIMTMINASLMRVRKE